MGKEERDKRREEKEKQDALIEEMKKKDKLNALNTVIKILKDNKLKEEKIVMVNQRFSLFSGKNYAEICERYYDEMVKLLDLHFGQKLGQEKDEGKRRVALTNFLLSNQVIFKVEENKETPKIRDGHNTYIPTQVQEVKSDKEVIDGFFVSNPRINVQPKSSYIYMVLILIGIALIILFPVWPLVLKRGLFYLSVVMLFFLIGLIIVRTFLYFLVRVFGYDFYLFPNLFADVSFFQSFTPIIGYDKCEDSGLVIVFRILGIFILAGGIYLMSLEHKQIQNFGQQSFEDILEWGYEKLENTKAPPPKSIEQIMDDFDKQYEEGGIPEQGRDL